ncbi:MAG: fumarate hydratase [Candidatus Marinimicrobia bacterium]|nr:fumarate hydratase [Candidatus Neomarinimicrobiota bacterium]
MKTIDVAQIVPVVKKLCIDANYYVTAEVLAKARASLKNEKSETGREILAMMLENYELAAQLQMPLCQDTGVAVVFVELGQDVHLTGGDFNQAIDEGVRQGYIEGYLRKAIVTDPVVNRKNTGDNTPAIIYTEIVPGDSLKITVAPKGGGSENMSQVKMMNVSGGLDSVKDYIVDCVKIAGGRPCPPVIVGVGLGGDFEQAALLAKKALLRPLDEKNPDPFWAEVEQELLERINRLGIGPQGLGGSTTAWAVSILHRPCHIASMPVAVNLDCYCHRHETYIF